jgi:hypothetical protein
MKRELPDRSGDAIRARRGRDGLSGGADRNRQVRIALVWTVIAFLLGSHLAWLNPRPGFEIYRTLDGWPFMWQYNADAGMEIISAAYFPHAFREYPQRINRPLYPVAAWTLGQLVDLAIAPARLVLPLPSLSPLERAGAGYILLKLIVHVAGAAALMSLLERRLSPLAAYFATGLVMVHPHTLSYVATFHTTELQVFVPVFVLWMAARLGAPDGSRRWWVGLVAASLVTGVLMMGKQNFAVYAALLVWALTRRYWREAFVSVGAFLIPLGVYALFLRAVGLSYSNNEIAAMGQGRWVIDLLRGNPVVAYQTLADTLVAFGRNAVSFWGAFLLLCFLALGRSDRPLTAAHLWFLFLFAGATWAQYVAVARLDITYMVGDLTLYVIGLAAWLVVDRWRVITRPAAAHAVITAALLLTLLGFVHIPWVSPWDQAYRDGDYLESRREAVEAAGPGRSAE